MKHLTQYIWILFILVNFFNAYLLRKKAAAFIEESPEKENGYKIIFKNFLIYGSIPWIIIGIGNTFGLTESVFDYFQPSKMNPMVLLFHFSIIVIWILLIRFIFFKNGAKFLENHPGIIRVNSFGNINDNPSENTIKLITIVGIIGGIIAISIMWFVTIPFPK
jgi:hypothetical protein